MFGPIRYKSDDFSGNSNTKQRDMRSVVIHDISLMSHTSDRRVTRKYKFTRELSELIHLDKSGNLWANVGTR